MRHSDAIASKQAVIGREFGVRISHLGLARRWFLRKKTALHAGQRASLGQPEPVMLGTRLAAQSNTKVVSSHKVVCTKLLRPCRPVGNSLWRHTTFRRKQWQSGAQLVAQCAEQAASTDPDGDRRSRQHFEGLPAGYRIRYATLQDADQIGKINAEASSEMIMKVHVSLMADD